MSYKNIYLVGGVRINGEWKSTIVRGCDIKNRMIKEMRNSGVYYYVEWRKMIKDKGFESIPHRIFCKEVNK